MNQPNQPHETYSGFNTDTASVANDRSAVIQNILRSQEANLASESQSGPTSLWQDKLLMFVTGTAAVGAAVSLATALSLGMPNSNEHNAEAAPVAPIVTDFSSMSDAWSSVKQTVNDVQAAQSGAEINQILARHGMEIDPEVMERLETFSIDQYPIVGEIRSTINDIKNSEIVQALEDFSIDQYPIVGEIRSTINDVKNSEIVQGFQNYVSAQSGAAQNFYIERLSELSEIGQLTPSGHLTSAIIQQVDLDQLSNPTKLSSSNAVSNAEEEMFSGDIAPLGISSIQRRRADVESVSQQAPSARTLGPR